MSRSSDVLEAGQVKNVRAMVASLSLRQKASLTAGRDMWSTSPIEEAGIPSWRMTDGPSGVRGRILGHAGVPALCFPSGSALGASWNVSLLEEVGAALGKEARDRGARILLGPTVNIHRSPLAGRTFECFAEDPELTGLLAAAYVRGAQGQGVIATVKHLAGNEAEFNRNYINSIIDERTLREIYLRPFEICVKEADALGIMTAYNRLNGQFCADSRWLLQDVLRDEWGFSGIVVSDWWALAETCAASEAGLDIEMPGPGRAYGQALADAVSRGEVEQERLDKIAERILTVMSRIGALADASDLPETSNCGAAEFALARRAAQESMVLIKNDEDLLPLAPDVVSKIAVIGPNASRAQIMGGGSAHLRAPHYTSPIESITAAANGAGIEVAFERGCLVTDDFTILEAADLTTPSGKKGIEVEYYAPPNADAEPQVHLGDSTEFIVMGEPAPGLAAGPFLIKARGVYRVTWSGTHQFRFEANTTSHLIIDGIAELSNSWSGTDQVREQRQQTIDVDLVAGSTLSFFIEIAGDSTTGLCQVALKCRPPASQHGIDRAIDIARDADVAIVVVGTDYSLESEGFDRTSLALPQPQIDLLRKVLAANRRTLVVVNSGAPVEMPWLDDACAVLQCWFGGQEMAPALADIIFGHAEPGGRMPISVPIRIEHTPAFGNFPGLGEEIRYGEGVLVGYRWYEARQLPLAVPFGHGLSFTCFSYEIGTIADRFSHLDREITVPVTVANVGLRQGSEVIQVYVSPPAGRVIRPPKELRGFAKVHLQPGETKTIEIRLTPRAFSFWHPGDQVPKAIEAQIAMTPFSKNHPEPKRTKGWAIDEGIHTLHIARSSTDILASHQISVEFSSEGMNA